METYYLVMRADLTTGAAHYETEEQAREMARKLAEKTGKPFIVARVIGRAEIEKFPVRWVELGEPDTSE